jgi:hypothetical protein
MVIKINKINKGMELIINKINYRGHFCKSTGPREFHKFLNYVIKEKD